LNLKGKELGAGPSKDRRIELVHFPASSRVPGYDSLARRCNNDNETAEHVFLHYPRRLGGVYGREGPHYRSWSQIQVDSRYSKVADIE
jgi:hypothetical protein